jgi:hypothetical protein
MAAVITHEKFMGGAHAGRIDRSQRGLRTSHCAKALFGEPEFQARPTIRAGALIPLVCWRVKWSEEDAVLDAGSTCMCS